MAEGTIIDSNPHRSKWRLTGLLLALALAAEIFFLLRDIPLLQAPPSTGGPQSAPIAELASQRNTVRVQSPDDLVWNDAANGQVLRRMESVMTGDRAGAEIAFLDGTGLSLGEDSLVQLEKSPGDESANYDRIVLRLIRGSVRKTRPRGAAKAAPSASFEIEVGGAKAMVPATAELSVVATPEGPARMIVDEGTVELTTPAGTTKIAHNEEALIAKPGTPEAAKPPISRQLLFDLISPVERVTGPRVVFRWNTSPSAWQGGPIEVLASSDPTFQKGVRSATIAATEPPLKFVETTLDLGAAEAPQLWHWKVRSIAGGRESRVQNFWLDPEARPRALYPLDGSVFVPDSPIDLEWEALPGATSYEIEISGDAKHDVRKLDSEATRLQLGPARALGAGAFTWKVRARLAGDALSPPSEAWHLSVGTAAQPIPLAAPTATPKPAKKKHHSLAPPKMLKPEFKPIKKRHSTSWFDYFEPAAWADDASDDDRPGWAITLHWGDVVGAKKYHVQIGRDRSFKKIISEGDAGKPEWDWIYHMGDENSKGRAFYRVASVDDTGARGDYSDAVAIEIPAPILEEAKKIAAAPPKPKPKPVPASETPAPSGPVTVSWHAHVGLDTGLAGLSEGTSDTLLTSVSAPVYLAQKIFAGLERVREQGAACTSWAALLQTTLVGFHAPSTVPAPAQPAAPTFATRLDLVHFGRGAFAPGAWRLGLGGSVDLSYRWVKSGPQSVVAEYGASLGPAASLSRRFDPATWFQPLGAGATLAVPFTGLIWDSQFSVQGEAWAEWNLKKFARTRLALRLAGEVGYSRWVSPSSASFFNWGAWLAPVYRWE